MSPYAYVDHNSLSNISFSTEEMMTFLRSHGYTFEEEKYTYHINVYHNDTEECHGTIIIPSRDGKQMFVEERRFSDYSKKEDFVRKLFFQELKYSIMNAFSGS